MPHETLKEIKPRKYQEDIYNICKDKNCLVVLPTGMGKTLIALMLVINRQKSFPGNKCLFLAPTRPLAQQHMNYFKKHLPELFAQLDLFTGKVDAEKRKELWERSDIIFSTPQCIDGGTLIFTEDGPIKISEFFKKFNLKEEIYLNGPAKSSEINQKVLGFNGKEISFLNASKGWKFQRKELIEFKTELGNKLLCTKDHPLLTINTHGKLYWKQAAQLEKGDYIASVKEIKTKETEIDILEILSNNEHLKIANKNMTKELINTLKKNKIKTSKYSKYLHNFMPLKTFLELSNKVGFKHKALNFTDKQGRSSNLIIPKQLDYKLSYILGAMLGDGHIGNRKGRGSEVVFSDLDRITVSNYFREKLKETFGVEMKEDRSKGLITYNSALAEILKGLGVPSGSKAKKISIPKFLFFANSECIKGFVKGIFDTDGCASKYGVSISSASEGFIEELKWLFLKLGITGSIEKTTSRGLINGRELKESCIYNFRFSGRRNLVKFLEVIPDSDKSKKLEEALRNTKKPETRAKETIPVIELMKKIRKVNKNKAEYYKFSCLSKNNLEKLSKNLEGEEADRLRELLKLPIRWVKIKKRIEINEEKEVYDLTIDEHHNFIANSLINHNCIANDIKNDLYNLENVSLLIEDECHRCLKNYAYTYIIERYKEQSKFPRILGLTASPGADRKTIQQIADNLSIEAIELRTRESEDVKEYLQELKFEIIKLDFPGEFEKIKSPLQKIFNKKVDELKNRKLLFTPPTKKFLLETQHKIMQAISTGNRNFNLLAGASACAIAVKIQHALELLETQTLFSLQNYFYELFNQANKKQSRAVQQLVKFPEFNQAFTHLNELMAKKIENPKLLKLKEIVEAEINQNPKAKIIIFSQYRDNVARICKEMNTIENIRAKIFIGQATKINHKGEQQEGLSQKEQQEIIKEFSEGKINLICCTAIGEEGLDIPEVNAVIFYEPIPSAIRTIQRCLPKDSRILMYNGSYKKIADILEGNRVISYDEKAKQLKANRVLRIFKNGARELIEITTEKNNKIKSSENHPLLTPEGWVNAKELKEGDFVALCHSPNTYVKYFSLADFLPKETYICNSKELKENIIANKITYEEIQKKLASKGINVNKKTLWGYINRDAIPIKIFLNILNILRIPKEKANINLIKSRMGKAIDISKINLSEFMWLLGIVSSDGDLRKMPRIRKGRTIPYYTYRIRVCNSNKEIISKVNKIFKKMGLTIRTYADKIESSNTIIGKILNNLGLPVKGKKSKTLEMSDELFNFDNSSLESFLAGLFDGDGNYNKGPCQIRLGTGSKKLAFQLQSILLRIGIISKICQFDKTEIRNIRGKVAHFTGDFFSVEIYKKEDVAKFLRIKEIVKVKNPHVKIQYSKNLHKENCIFWVKIKKVDNLSKEEVYNLEVENNNTFVAENIIVHNSGRTARLTPGKVIILMIKKTRDEAYHWAAFHKERKMYSAIKSIKENLDNGKKNFENKNQEEPERGQRKLF
jgi:ERCC4-related helicase/intein/homing endonuclease